MADPASRLLDPAHAPLFHVKGSAVAAAALAAEASTLRRGNSGLQQQYSGGGGPHDDKLPGGKYVAGGEEEEEEERGSFPMRTGLDHVSFMHGPAMYPTLSHALYPGLYPAYTGP